MAVPKNPKREAHFPADKQPNHSESRLRRKWDKEANRRLNENDLRRKPDWLEAIGDEDEDERVEANLRDEMSLRGEDDFVSDPTGAADVPTWVDDDYDDESHT